MGGVLILLIILSLFLVFVSCLIWKSKLPDNDKIVSLIMILVFFSLITIINESKRSTIQLKKTETQGVSHLNLL